MRPVRVATVVAPLVLAFTAALGLLFVAYASADTGTTSDPGMVDDAFTAGRRSGFLFVAVGIAIAAIAQFVLVRLKPKGASPTGWRAKLTVALGAVSMVALAVVDMFAESRGLTPVVTAAVGGLALWRHAAPDPERGSKRKDEAAGEVEAAP